MTVDINQIIKMKPFIVPNHDPNTTHLAHMSLLGYPTQVYKPSTEGVISCHLIIPVTIWSD